MKGLFVELTTTSPGDLSDFVNHVVAHDPGIEELVFWGTQSWDWPVLDALNWDKTSYYGAVPFPWYGPRPDTPTDLQDWMKGITGVEGMMTPSYRWDQIAADIALYQNSSLRSKNFYVVQEVGIDALGDHPRLRAAWEAYFVELCRQIYSLGGMTAKVLWSPYAWNLWSKTTATKKKNIANAVKALVDNTRLYSGTPGITTIDLQDGRGAQPEEPETDALNWYNLIKDCGATVRINAEWFTQTLRPQDKEVMRARLDFYSSHGVPVGNCWERRCWYYPGWVVNH